MSVDLTVTGPVDLSLDGEPDTTLDLDSSGAVVLDLDSAGAVVLDLERTSDAYLFDLDADSFDVRLTGETATLSLGEAGWNLGLSYAPGFDVVVYTRVTEGGDTRITENGDTRIREAA